MNLFVALRRTSIVVMKYFIQFKEEFSRGVLGYGYKLENIINFPSFYLIRVGSDTSYLSDGEYLSSLFGSRICPDLFAFTE